jgi:selenide,water dikinase
MPTTSPPAPLPNPETSPAIRLTEFSHGGGCGCKIAPAVLSRLLASTNLPLLPPDLLVGTETSDDAAVYRLNDQQAIIATTDFFTPIVDDPYDFGRIAATNALSDVYAMGGTPLFALALVGMPLGKIPEEAIRLILAGGQDVCKAAGIPVAGGHSIDTLEPIYGLVGIGLVHPDKVKRNSAAQDGDVLILSKPLGVGILSAALKKGTLSAQGYADMVRWTTKLNTPGIALADMPEVHAMTDVTGFGLAGHLLEICRGSSLAAQVNFDAVPLIALASDIAQQGTATGASKRNWDGYGSSIVLPADCPLWKQNMLSDPQTSGGLLIACAPQVAERVLEILRAQDFVDAAIIGTLAAGAAHIQVV